MKLEDIKPQKNTKIKINTKMNPTSLSKVENLYLGQISWRYYNKIKKKAMEQEFSMSGLFISVSIAFFIVALGSYYLSLVHGSLQQTRFIKNNNIYQLENINHPAAENYLQVDLLGAERLDNVRVQNLA